METFIVVQNLKCGGCANTITKNISQLENISKVKVDIAKSQVLFHYEQESDIDSVFQKLNAIGYPSVDETNSTYTKVKSYISCATGKL